MFVCSVFKEFDSALWNPQAGSPAGALRIRRRAGIMMVPLNTYQERCIR